MLQIRRILSTFAKDEIRKNMNLYTFKNKIK